MTLNKCAIFNLISTSKKAGNEFDVLSDPTDYFNLKVAYKMTKILSS
ncbi:MAG: hypothetical protein ACFE9N_06785 [Promethearchaeota archaeon]